MSWVYLIVAGMSELGWGVGFKHVWPETGPRWGWIAFTALCLTTSGVFMALALREIPVGTAYVVFTGIGAVGLFLIGILFYGEPAQAARFLFAGLIVAGMVGLKLTSS